VILACLGRIRTRLWLTRLTERLALTLVWAATLELFFMGAYLVRDRWLWLAMLILIVPPIAGGWIWRKAERLAAGRIAQAWGISFLFLRLNAAITCAVSLGLLADVIHPNPGAMPLWSRMIAGFLLFLFIAALMVRRATTREVAIFVDQQVGLKERVSTALELCHPTPAQPTTALEVAFRTPVIASAIAACQSVRAAKVGYRRVDSRVYPLAATMVIAAAAACFVPPMQAIARSNQHAPYLNVITRGTKMLEKIQELENDPKLANDPNMQQKLKEFKEIAADMRQGTMSEFEAQNRIASVMQGIKESQAKADEATALEKSFSKEFPEFGPSPSGENGKSDTGNNTGKQSNGQPSDGGQKASAGSRAQKAAGEMADKLKGMSQQDREALAKKLDAAANKATDAATKESLKEAAKAAREGNSDQFAQSMADAAKSIAQQNAQAAAQSEANRAMENIARGGQTGSQMESQMGEMEGGSPSANQQGNSSSDNPSNEANQSAGGDQQGSSDQQTAGNQPGEDGQSGDSQANNGAGGNPGEQGDENGGQNGQNGTGESTASNGDGTPNQGGSGSTNFYNPGGRGSKNRNDPIRKTPQTFVRIYDPKNVDTTGKSEQIHGTINPLGTPSKTINSTVVPGKGQTIQRYEEVLPDVRKRALDDIETQQIPPQYKDMVREFYQPTK